MKYTSQHAARALEIVQRVLPHVSPQKEYLELISILKEPARWKEAHDQFSKIRRQITIPLEQRNKSDLDACFARLVENAAKTAYNCSGESAPFDQASFDRLLTCETEFLEKMKNEAKRT
jgi:hypothetical protein